MVSLCVRQCRKPAPLAGMTLLFCLSTEVHCLTDDACIPNLDWSRFFTGKCRFILDGSKEKWVRGLRWAKTKEIKKNKENNRKENSLVLWRTCASFFEVELQKAAGDTRLRRFVMFLIIGVVWENNFYNKWKKWLNSLILNAPVLRSVNRWSLKGSWTSLTHGLTESLFHSSFIFLIL